MSKVIETRFFFDEFEVDAERRILLKNGQIVALNPKTFDLLLALIQRHGEIFSKNDLLDAVWENQYVEEKNLTVHIAALRKALGERKDENRFIVTVPGKGYKFVAPLNGSETNGFQDKRQKVKDKNSSLKYLYFLPVFLLPLLVLGYFWRNIEQKPNPPLSVKSLTNNGNVQTAILSRDGKFFAYSVKEKGTYRTEIRLGQINGSRDTVLIPMSETVFNPIAFSADGSSLYYVQTQPRERENGTLFKMPVLGGVSQKLADGFNRYSVISPDEKQIAFVRDNEEKKTSSLMIANLDGTNEGELVARPSGQSIHPLSLAWSSDGSLIAFGAMSENGNREIFAADSKDGKIAQITKNNWVEIAKLEWLKDQNSLLAVARDKNSAALTQIWNIEYPAGTVRAITSDVSKYGSSLSLSADSLALMAVRVNSESNIWVAPADNLKEAKQITFSSLGRQDGWYGMDWTSDGRIVYTALTDQSRSIWVMNADGANVKQLTPNGFQDTRLSVSADGKFVVFDSNRSGKSEIWRVGTDGSRLQQLTTDGGNTNPSVTPDGKWLVYQNSVAEGNSIRRVSLEGGEPIQLTNKEANNPRVSPDGKFVACGYSVVGKTQLAVISIEGGEPLKLFDVPPTFNFDNTGIRWSPNGHSINYRDWSNGIWQQSIEGGAPVRLENLPQEKFYTYGWSADSKKFAFVRGQEIRDVVLMSNLR